MVRLHHGVTQRRPERDGKSVISLHVFQVRVLYCLKL